jgi:hypothetical protein
MKLTGAQPASGSVGAFLVAMSIDLSCKSL